MIMPFVLAALQQTGPVVMKSIEGKPQTVIGDRSMKGTVLFLVMTDCPIARKYLPEISRIGRDYQAKGIRSYLVHEDPATTPLAISNFCRSFGITMPSVIDPGVLRKRARAFAAPTAALFDPTGRLVYSGRIDDRFPILGVQRLPQHNDLRTAIDQLLRGQPVKPSRTVAIGCAFPRG